MLKELVPVQCPQVSEADILAERVEQANRALLLQMRDFPRQDPAACRRITAFFYDLPQY